MRARRDAGHAAPSLNSSSTSRPKAFGSAPNRYPPVLTRSLKAVLLNEGYTAEQVKDFGHKLNKLFKETRRAGLDWSDLDTKAITFYARAVLEHAFRYRDSARPYVLDDQKILAFTETVFRRCAQALGAQRSLKPRPRRRGP